MNSLLLHRLVKVAPFAMTVLSLLFLAHGWHFGTHGDPIGPGGPNFHMGLNGDPIGPGGPN
jgi:hypothetical protein